VKARLFAAFKSLLACCGVDARVDHAASPSIPASCTRGLLYHKYLGSLHWHEIKQHIGVECYLERSREVQLPDLIVSQFRNFTPTFCNVVSESNAK